MDSLLGTNSMNEVLRSFMVFVGVLVALKIIQLLVLQKLKKLAEKTENDFDDTVIAILQNVKPPMYVIVALFIGLNALALPSGAKTLLTLVFVLGLVYEGIQAIDGIVMFFLKKHLAKDGDEREEAQLESMMNAARVVMKIILWTFGATIALANIGVDVTSLVAGMGIGGLAIALAVQNVLSDMFSSFSIYIDKPFQVGDYIVIGSDSGTVEQIGLKSTRLKTLQGETLIISNKELTSVRVQNFKLMETRRVVFGLGLEYGTPLASMEAVPGIVEEILAGVENADFDRCHFKGYGDSTLDFETVFYVNTADYAEYMNIMQTVNLAIYERFEKEKLGFAFPTQTIHLVK